MTDCDAVIARLPPLPPSVQSVVCALASTSPMTGAQLRDSTGLPRRTIYAALQRLKEMGILRERVSLKDTRQTYFWIKPEQTATA